MRTKKDILQQILMNSDETNRLLRNIESGLNEILIFWELLKKEETRPK